MNDDELKRRPCAGGHFGTGVDQDTETHRKVPNPATSKGKKQFTRCMLTLCVAVILTAIHPPAWAADSLKLAAHLESRQQEALTRIQKNASDLAIDWHENTALALPRLISGELTKPTTQPPTAIAENALLDVQDVFGIQLQDLSNARVSGGEGGAHVEYDQTYRGRPVYNAGIMIHIRGDGVISAITGLYLPDINVSTEPTVSKEKAAEAAVRSSSERVTADIDPELVVIPVVSANVRSDHLAWKMRLHNRPEGESDADAASCDCATTTVFVDAHSGNVVFSFRDSEPPKHELISVNNDAGMDAAASTARAATVLAQPKKASAEPLYEYGGNNSRRSGEDVSCIYKCAWLVACWVEDNDSPVRAESVWLANSSYQLFGDHMGQYFIVLPEFTNPQRYDDGSVTIDWERHTDYTWVSFTKFADHVDYRFHVKARAKSPFNCYQGHLWFTVGVRGRRAAAAPSGVSASAVSASTVALTWQNNTNTANAISIERSAAAGWSEIASVAATVSSFEQTSLNPGSQYCYRIRACANDGSCTSYSNESCTTTCAASFDAVLQVVRSGFRFSMANQRYVQTVTAKNVGDAIIPGPLTLVLDSLSPGVGLFAGNGTTACAPPRGSPYMTLMPASTGLSPGASISSVLEFVNPQNQGIAYKTRTLAGVGVR